MRTILIIIALCGVASAQDYQGAVAYHIETTSTNVVPIVDGSWQTRDLFGLSCVLGGAVHVDRWNVPDCAKPSDETLAALATNATVLAWAKEKLDNAPIVIEPPNANTRYGTAEKPIKELYVSTNTLYIGSQPVRADADGIKLKASVTGSGWKPNGQVQERLEALERILGLRE